MSTTATARPAAIYPAQVLGSGAEDTLILHVEHPDMRDYTQRSIPFLAFQVKATGALAPGATDADVHLDFAKGKPRVIAYGPPGSVTLPEPEVLAPATAHHWGLTPRDTPDGIDWPSIDPYFLLTPSQQRLLRRLNRMRRGEPKPVCVLITGPSGTGKSRLAQQFAALTHSPFVKTDTNRIEDSPDWYTRRGISGGSTHHDATAFTKGLALPGAVHLIDEVNRREARVTTGLYPIMDDFGQVWVEGHGYVNVAPGTIIFATANIGQLGTVGIPEALLERFGTHLEMGYLPAGDEVAIYHHQWGVDKAIADSLVALFAELRDLAQRQDAQALRYAPSQRMGIDVCRHLKYGATPEEALESVIIPLYEQDGGIESERARVAAAIQAKFGS